MRKSFIVKILTIPQGRIADGADQCLHAAREELRQGADFIKIMVSGGVVSPTDRLVNLQYTREEIRAFTKVAHDSGTWVSLPIHLRPQAYVAQSCQSWDDNASCQNRDHHRLPTRLFGRIKYLAVAIVPRWSRETIE